MLRPFLLAGLLTLGASAVSAQSLNPGPVGPFVVDLRGSLIGVPQAAAFHPPPTSDTFVPARGFGVLAGGHVYLFRFKAARVGVGAEWMTTRATAQTQGSTGSSTGSSSSSGSSSGSGSSSSGSSTTATPGPRMVVTNRTLTPQVSLNFGNEYGWSYLSAGFGTMMVRSRLETTTAAEQSTSTSVINFGGGARWFTKRHLGVGFDLRFNRLAAGGMLFSAAAGVSVK